jgi:uncharacterized phage protein gp47/JayE
MATFDEYGLVIDTQPTIQENLEDAFKTSFGDNIRLDAQSVFGQLIQNLSLTLAEIQELVESVSSGFDPQSASGTALSKLVLLNGIQRSEGTYSTVVLSCTASGATTIPAGSLVEDATGNQFATDTNLVFAGAGTSTVNATCTELGPIEAVAATLTTIVNAVYRWTAVTNAADAIPGELEETDAALRLRRQEVAERASTTSISALYGAITDVAGVSSAGILVNSSTETDDNGIPPQHVECLIDGVTTGNEQDIGAAIFNHVSAGISTVGETLIDYFDPISESTYTVYYSEPILVLITVDVYYTDLNSGLNSSEIEALVEEALIDHFADFTIGQDVIYSRLYSPLNSIPGIQIDDMQISDSGVWGGLRVSIPIDVRSKAYVTEASILVTEM